MNGQYRIGDTVMSNWVLAKKLGEGSFGKVYQIERTDFGETYRAALKIITVPQSSAEIQAALEEGMSPEEAESYFYSMVEDIVREFALMAKVKGTAYVVSYEDHQVVRHEQGLGWDILIRMEELTPLLTYAYAHPFTRRDVIRLGIHMCKSLELCQKYNIIHRDLKPENIFVSENGDFKLGDFGIARTVEKTMSGLSKKGTYNYMAPEVYKGLDYGFSVDIYSLGIVLYRLLNKNRVPFLPPAPEPLTYSSRERALARRMSGDPLPLPCYGNGRLGEIILKAAAYDPKERYSSPLQMRQELEAILYDSRDVSIIYPEGDEVSLKENIYATMKQKPRAEAEPDSEEPDSEEDVTKGGTVSGLSGGARKESGGGAGAWAAGQPGRGASSQAVDRSGRGASSQAANRTGRGASSRAADQTGRGASSQADSDGGDSRNLAARAIEETKVRESAVRGDEEDKTVSVFEPKKKISGQASGGDSGQNPGKCAPSNGKKIGIIAAAAAAVIAVGVGAAFLFGGNSPQGTESDGNPTAQEAMEETTQDSEEETGAAAAADAETYARLKAEAEELYDSNPAQAMELMAQALAVYPEEPGAQIDYVYALYRTGDYDGCISYGENDLALGRSFDAGQQSQLNEILGAAYYENGDYAGAAGYFRLSAAGDEMSESAMRDYAVCLARLGSAAEAKDVLAELRRKGADSDVTQYVEGEVNYAAAEYVEAEKIFQEVMEEGEDNYIIQRAFRSLAQLYRDCAAAERLGESPIEGAAIKEARLLASGIETYGLTYDSSLYEMLGQAAYEALGVADRLGWEYEMDYYQVAIEAFERVLALGMEKDYIYTNLYSIHYEMGDYDAAGSDLDRMESSFPKSYVPHALRGILYITLENGKAEASRDYHGAQDECTKARELVSSSDDTTYLQQLESLIDQLKSNGWL